MDDWNLPVELQELERDLGNRVVPEASARLRDCVLSDLRSELRAERSRDRWQFAAAVAATALLWMNLSMSVTQATDFGLRLTVPSEPIQPIARQIQQLVPEFSAEETRRHTIFQIPTEAKFRESHQ